MRTDIHFYRAAWNTSVGLATRKQSVCLSVCQTRGLWQNGRKFCSDFYTIRRII